jgi:dolichyl-phosphate-mannose-protein mannosyltransferase
MFPQLLSLLSVAVITLAAYGLGRPVLRGLNLVDDDRLTTGVWSIAVGLVLGGTLLTILGLIGLLYRPLIGVLSIVGCFWGIGLIVRQHLLRTTTEQRAVASQPPPAPWPPPARWISRAVLILALAACTGSLIGALAPPTAGDALCYHLELPKTFLADHAIRFLPDSDNSTFPLLAEIWYAWGLALDGPVAAGLIHWELGILLGLATVVLATPIVSRPWAWLAGAVVVLTPGVSNQMTAPMNDLALALMTTLAAAAWWQAIVAQESRRWFVLAGIAAGGALSVKYLALVFALAVAIPSCWMMLRGRPRRRLILEGVAVVSIVAVSFGGLWYVRAAWHRGNPVYPFLSEVFASSDSADRTVHQTLPKSKSPLGRGPIALATAPWQLTMHPDRFGGRGHQLGALFLAVLPGLAFSRRLRGLGILLAVSLVYFIAWYLLRQNVRFLLPIVPLMSVAVVWVWIEIRRLPAVPRLAAGCVFGGLLAAFSVVALERCRDQLAVAFAFESREHYLARCEPTWRAARVSNLIFGPEDHLLTQDYRGFYFDCRVTRENIYRRRVPYDRSITDPADFSRDLLEAGFTHVLLAENLYGQGIQYDPTLSRLADAQFTAGRHDSLIELADYHFPDSDGGLRRYRLVMLLR